MNQADFAANSPTGPAPSTTTVSPSRIEASCAPKYPVPSASVISRASSGSSQSGMTCGPTSANGTRTRSACPPS